jgi:maltose/moltooligosaccharide transporter
LQKELYILTVGLGVVGVLFLLASWIRKNKGRNGFVIIMTDLLYMPATMKQLAWVQFFSWFALFSMWIYTTQAVTGHIYGTRDTTSQLYNDGADWVTVLFAVYNGVAALVAFLLPVLAKMTSRKITHLLALTLGGIGLISVYFISDPDWLLLSMVGVGIAWASILSVPYAMLAGALPPKKMGYYMGVFNFFIVIPQMVAATILGFMVNQFFGNQPVYALVAGGIAMILSGLLTLRVHDEAVITIEEGE